MEPLRVGEVLHGYTGGYFGRDSYGPKRVEAIGADWVIAREDDGPVVFFGDPTLLDQYRDQSDTVPPVAPTERTSGDDDTEDAEQAGS